MHTPAQARELWCPMVRTARHEVIEVSSPAVGGMREAHMEHHVIAGCNRDALGGGNLAASISDRHVPLASCRCIADKCAMWRWGEETPLPKTLPCADPYPVTEEIERETRRLIGRESDIPVGWTFQAADPEEGTRSCWVEPLASRQARAIGYCGLAPVAGILA